MKRKYEHGHPRFYEIMEELMDLHDRKNADYGIEGNPFRNFYQVGKLAKMYGLITEGNEPIKVAILYALKQLDGALKLLQRGEKGNVEGVPERLKDIAVYAVIAIVLYEEASK